MTDDTNTPPADPPEASPLDPGDATGHAAYDTTLQRFVGPVYRGKSGKSDAGKSPQVKAAKDAGHTVEVREV
jgi:hypothetical protein